VSLNWTTIDNRINTPSLDTPLGAVALNADYKPQTVHSWSIELQRELPFRIRADVAYVGNRVVNQQTNLPINTVNPTQVANPRPDQIDRTTGNVLPANFLRPFIGRGDINVRAWIPDHYQRYDSIQAAVTRRLSEGLALTASYTGSLRKTYTQYDWYRTPEDNRNRYESAAGSRPHDLKFTYNWLIPGGGRLFGNRLIARGALDGWQLSGLTTMRGGTRTGFTYAFDGTTANIDTLTGGFGGSRPIIVCDPNLPRNERTFDRQFRTECVQPPGPRTDPNDTLYQGTGKGEGTLDAWTNLGFINHDVTLFKNFRMSNGRNVQIRVEAYNLLNSTQYQGVDTSAVFNFQTGAQTDANFGRVQNVRGGSERVIQLGFRLSF
jgi:hypothetical protein